MQGEVKSADIIDLEDAKKLLEASQKNRQIKIDWNEVNNQASKFEFRLDSIRRFDESSDLLVQWDGKAINADIEDREALEIPGRDNFTVVGVNHVKDDQDYLAI